jgi:hypothetical protein
MGVGSFVWKGLLAAGLLAPPQGVAEDHVYGRVETVRGEVHTGFVRWGPRAGAWADLLEGVKALPEENLRQARRLRAEADPEADLAARTIVYGGVRITWDEDDTEEAPDSTASGVRFGHVRRIVPDGPGAARLVLKSGLDVRLGARSAGAPSPGVASRERPIPFIGTIGVEVEGGRSVQLGWDDVASVDLMEPPPGIAPGASRLHGTVRTRSGAGYSGYLAWGAAGAFTDDLLSGREGGRELRIPFGEVVAIEPIGSAGARVTLGGGETLTLAEVLGDRRGSRSLRISDPSIGEIQIPWGWIEEVRLHAPEASTGYDAFDGGRRLGGTVVTRSGASVQGALRWDNDEEHTWEILNGRLVGPQQDAVTLAIDLSHVRSIVAETPRGVVVTLRDGRVMGLSGSNDVGLGNKGVVVERRDGSFRFVDWLDVREVVLDAP